MAAGEGAEVGASAWSMMASGFWRSGDVDGLAEAPWRVG